MSRSWTRRWTTPGGPVEPVTRVRWCICGHISYRSRGHARRMLDSHRQTCRRDGRPPEAWPVGVRRCTQSRAWHIFTDRRALELRLRSNFDTVRQLLEQAA